MGNIVHLYTNRQCIHKPLAKIIEIYAEKDKSCTISKNKTENGIFFCPPQRLFPLEVNTTKCSSSDNVIWQKLKYNKTRSGHNENAPEIAKTTASEEKITSSDYASIPKVLPEQDE